VGPTGPAGPGSEFPSDLTRIVALSWAHNEGSSLGGALIRRTNGQVVPGLAVAFGLSAATEGDGKPTDLRSIVFGSGSLDEFTFEAFILEPMVSNFGTRVYSRLPTFKTDERGAQIIPVRITRIVGERVAEAEEVPMPAAGGLVQADGAAMIFPSDVRADLNGLMLFIQLRCDLIRDAFYKLAVDGDFLSALTPTGNGIPGGTFWSWFTVEDGSELKA